MRRFAAIMLMLSAGGLGVLVSSGTAQVPDPNMQPGSSPDGGDVAVAQATGQQPPATGTQPTPSTPMMQPGAPMMPPGQSAATTPPTTAAPESGGSLGAGSAGGLLGGGATPAPSQVNAAQPPAADIVGGAQSTGRATTDVGDLLSRSPSATGVEVQHRNPIITDPRVRGYHVGELITTSDGGYWMPARQDLDTIVSKLDSSMVENVVVVKGPYSVRYGPGFAFLDVHTYDTPRYDVFENH